MFSKTKLTCILLLFAVTVLLGVTFQQNTSLSRENGDTRPSANASTDNFLTLNRYLERLIATHPKKEISIEFYQLIERGEIMTSWTSSNDAQFQLVPRQMIKVNTRSSNALIPVLFIDPQILREQPTRNAQLVIYHEYTHYRQWKDGLLPQSTFVLRTVESLSPEEFTKTCKEKWYAEEHAYQRECELAIELGWTDTMPLCKELSMPAFKNSLLRSLINGDETMNACSRAQIELL